MKTTRYVHLALILLAAPLTSTAQQYGAFLYASNGSVAWITGYTGAGGYVEIPHTINEMPVVGIASFAFYGNQVVTEIALPAFLEFIDDFAFAYSSSLRYVNFSFPYALRTIGNYAFADSSLYHVEIPDSVTTLGDYAFYNNGAVNARIGGGVARIGASAFSGCSLPEGCVLTDGLRAIGARAFASTYLPELTMPGSVTNLEDSAFADCHSLGPVYFSGNAPTANSSVFSGCGNAVIYYLPGTTGWAAMFAGRPAVLWNPVIQTGDSSFGVRSNRFGFNITGTPGIPIAIEAATTLNAPSWRLLQTGSPTGGAYYFSDATWTNSRSRFYRIRPPMFYEH